MSKVDEYTSQAMKYLADGPYRPEVFALLAIAEAIKMLAKAIKEKK